ncbi:het-s domain [Fusarium albosuccineum]|uniref:Het-s domain n=1 Tax=Fusarium albosuccineum TaxID=1237068 RepID=A0A8H4L3G2_9HYPO|nr:het-s domain [Fusarium albosuccineum]
MELAGVVLAAVSAVPVLIDYGQRIYRRVQDKKNLVPIAQELSLFGLEDRRNQVAVLVGLAQSILKSRIIEPEHKDRLVKTWDRMKELFIRLDKLTDIATNHSIRGSWERYKAQNELIDIGKEGMLTRLRNEFRDDVMMLREQLKDPSPLYLSPRDLTVIDDAGDYPVRMMRGRLTASRDLLSFIGESKPYTLNTKAEFQESINILAQKLSQAQPDTGILPFLGYRDEIGHDGGAFQLIFHSPSNMVAPPTLATHIAANRSKPSLNARVDFCYQLASAVLHTEVLGLVHKNIRPENILVYPSDAMRSPIAKPGEDIPALTLCGWQYAREVEQGTTRLTGDITLQRKIYQHPERQLPTAEREYSMAHDVYSLGVCMLEILCWESVLQPSPPFVSQAFVDTFNNLGFQPNDRDPGDCYTKFPNKNKAVLLSMCDKFIPCESGTKMTRIVRDFLMCLDDNVHQDSDDDLSQYVLSNETDRIKVAMNFVDTALNDLRNIQASI